MVSIPEMVLHKGGNASRKLAFREYSGPRGEAGGDHNFALQINDYPGGSRGGQLGQILAKLLGARAKGGADEPDWDEMNLWS